MPDGHAREPDAIEEAGPSATEGTDGRSGERPEADAAGTHPESADREFDWRGWLLVGVVLVAFLVIPGIIYLFPRVGPMFGLTFWDAYLALPMIPAVVLGLLAVWVTTRP